jgi:Ca-activated chloride channel family protein
MIETLFGITWGAIQNMVVVIPLVILAFACLMYRISKSNKAVALLSSSAWSKKIVLHFSPIRSYFKAFLFTLGTLFLAITLLHPQWNKKEETISQEGRDLFIALDVSKSMLAKDCLPSRLECAKNKIKELVKKLSCERVGLILFSGSAFVQCPLTSDYSAFFMFLDQVDVETISSGSTAFDAAILKVIEAFSGSLERKNKLVVLFTDGEDFSSNLQQVKQNVQEQGLHIFTFGVGTPDGAPIPILDEHGRQKGHQLDKKGSVVISRLNEGILYNLAHDSGGSYIRLTQDDSDIRSLIGQVQQFEKEKIEDKKVARAEEQYPYFLLVSFICFALEWLL